jgi:excisionase family DNA binding protein
MTLKEVQAIFKVHRNTLYTWIKQGKLKATQVSKRYFVKEEDIKELLK